MLAPRKKLWSTPKSVITTIAELTDLGPDDVCYDVGCGDGRVLIHLASSTTCRHFVGIEINPFRAEEAKTNVSQAKMNGIIDENVRIDIYCDNALEVNYDDATVIFLYLVPRGLRLIKPFLLSKTRQTGGGNPRENEKGSKTQPDGVGEENDDGGRSHTLRDIEKLAVIDNDVEDDGTAKNDPKRQQLVQCQHLSPLRVVTYMAGFEDERYVTKKLCKVNHQHGAAWPLYLYHFDRDNND